jgi:hypothetical protein
MVQPDPNKLPCFHAKAVPMKPLPLVALLAVATLATPALAGPRHWQGRPGTPIGAYGYTPGYDSAYRPGRGYGRAHGRAVPVHGGFYPPPRAFRPAFYPPVYAAPVVRYRPVVYGAPIVYGGYVQPVPVPVAYGGFPGQYGFGGLPPGRFYDPCRSTGTGAVLGAIAGGLIGNGIAGPYDRSLGTVVGAGLGAVTGTAIERSQRCGF